MAAEETSPDEVLRSVADAGAGAVVLFLGTVRDFGDSGRVRGITYEAYVPLATKSLADIRQEMLRRWTLKKVRMAHRTGRLGLGEVSVAIAVSSAHRQEAFEACRFGTEMVKKSAPIWKKERLATGAEIWSGGREIVRARRF